eukprot:3005860-Amphidinium_carterae.1
MTVHSYFLCKRVSLNPLGIHTVKLYWKGCLACYRDHSLQCTSVNEVSLGWVACLMYKQQVWLVKGKWFGDLT